MSDTSGEKRDSRPTNTDMTSERTQPHVAERLDRATLAALIDGRLQGADRDAALSKLATSPEDLEILADVVAVSRELDGGVTDIRTFAERPRARRPPMMKWMSAAAAILVVASASLMLRGGGTAAADGFASLITSQVALAPGWEAHSWSATRGAGDGISERARGIQRRCAQRAPSRSLAARGDSGASDGCGADRGAAGGCAGGGRGGGDVSRFVGDPRRDFVGAIAESAERRARDGVAGGVRRGCMAGSRAHRGGGARLGVLCDEGVAAAT